MGGGDGMTSMQRGRGVKYLLCAAELESGGCHGDAGVRTGARGRTLRGAVRVWDANGTQSCLSPLACGESAHKRAHVRAGVVCVPVS